MVFPEHKCIFIHVPRTAGTSMEMAICGQLKIPYKHYDPVRVKKMVGEDTWNQYFKFMFVRNPWDRLVSVYHWLISCESYEYFIAKKWQKRWRRHLEEFGKLEFPEFVRWFRTVGLAQPQACWFHEDLDFIGRFENLQEDFKHVCETIGVDYFELRQFARRKRIHPHYSCYYDEETRDIVGDIYKDDIEKFGYVFKHVCVRAVSPEKLGDESESTTE